VEAENVRAYWVSCALWLAHRGQSVERLNLRPGKTYKEIKTKTLDVFFIII